MIDPFAGDGCTGFIDGIGGANWAHCCDAHDDAFLHGETLQEFVQANRDLRDCANAEADPVGTIMFIFVMTVGALFYAFGPKKRKPK
jgi:hypothetical protein